VHLRQRAGFEAIQLVPPFPAAIHETRLAENRQVLRDGGLGQAGRLGKLTDGRFTRYHRVKQGPPVGIGNSSKYVS